MTSAVRKDPPGLRAALVLTLLAIFCAFLVALTHHLTRDRITENNRQLVLNQFAPVLNGIPHDYLSLEDPLILRGVEQLPGNGDARIYGVFSAETIRGYAFEVNAPGYNGPITLLIGIKTDLTISAVRVTRHTETPGLGDAIDERRSNWIHSYDRLSLTSPSRELWALKADGGYFDQLTGASITPRAIVRAVAKTLSYLEVNRETLDQQLLRLKQGREIDRQ